MRVSLIIVISLVVVTNAQLVKEIVKGQINEVVRATKEQLGLDIEVAGTSGYTPRETDGKNITFVLTGSGFGSHGDPFVKLGFTSNDETIQREFGNTESNVASPSSPEWKQAFWFLWKKGSGQKWHFRVLDHKSENELIGAGDLDVDTFAMLNSATIVSLANYTEATLTVKPTTPLRFKLQASNLVRSDEFNGKSDPYVKVYFRQGEHGKDKKFFTTSTIDNVENAKWDDIIEFPNYVRSSDLYLHFKVRDSDSFTNDDHLGEVIVPADSIHGAEQTVYLENSGEHSSLTIIPV